MMASSTSPLGSSKSLMALYSLAILLQVHLAIANYPSENSVPHDCLRKCEWPPKPRICRFEFTLEWFHTMSTACFDCPFNQTDCYRPHCIPVNGAPRAIAVVNRQFPGPSIQVCEFDTIEVKVRNELINGEGVTIHWHGVHQRGTPHMDGVSLITQCPITYRSSFTYQFKAETVGTHFWHAHGVQVSDGVLGSLVIRQASPSDDHIGLYDHDLPEHVIIIHDWTNKLFIDKYSRIIFHDLEISPDTLLIHGKGRYREFTVKATNDTIYTPHHVVYVQQGKRYRFRTIGNTALDCAFEISIDGHNLTIIASDGAPVEPFEVRAYGLTSGERYDFVLAAKAAVGKYWMRVKGRDSCSHLQESALVVYEGASDYPDPSREEPLTTGGIVLNPFNMKSSATVLNANELIATGDDNGTVREADVVHYISFQFEFVNNDNFNHPQFYPAFAVKGDPSTFMGIPSPQLNHVSFKPPTKPLLTQSREISEFEICTFEQTLAAREHCRVEHCECTHVLEVALGKVVELVLVDKGGQFTSAHPMHLHGFRFQILAHDKLGESTTVEEVMRLDKAGNITRRVMNAPLKDTVAVPDGGYVVVRFVADNPGWWLFHCHTQFHFLAGMSMVIHVGSDEDIPPLPPNFPRCGGDWYPKEDQTGRAPTIPMPNNAADIRLGGLMTSCCVMAGSVLFALSFFS